MLFGAHLVEDPDPEATQFGIKRDVPHSPAPTPFTQFLRSSRFAAAPAPAPAGALAMLLDVLVLGHLLWGRGAAAGV